MLKHSILAATFCLLVSTSAWAQPVPEFDINASCKEVAAAGGGSSVIELQCRKDENAAKGRIAAMTSSAAAMNTCVEIASAGGASYLILEQCLKDETAAEKALGK